MTGDVDYLLKLRVENMAAYDAVYRRIIRSIRLTDVSSAFSMEEIKFTTALPLTARPSCPSRRARRGASARVALAEFGGARGQRLSLARDEDREIGRATCRARGGQDVSVSGGDVHLNKNIN